MPKAGKRLFVTSRWSVIVVVTIVTQASSSWAVCRVISSIYECLCPRSKWKTAWAINTKLVRYTVHSRPWGLKFKRSHGYQMCCQRGHAGRHDCLSFLVVDVTRVTSVRTASWHQSCRMSSSPRIHAWPMSTHTHTHTHTHQTKCTTTLHQQTHSSPAVQIK